MSGSEILVLFLSATSIFLLLGIALIIFVAQYQKRVMQQAEDLKDQKAKHQEKLLQGTIESQEKERSRIASELHDGLGAQLSMIRLNLLMYGQEHEQMNSFAEETAGMLSDSIQVVREISHNLLPGTLKTYGLDAACKELCNAIHYATKLDAKYTSQEASFRLTETQELALYRIVQELTNNTLRHANANNIELNINWNTDIITVQYKDDGKGFKIEPGAEGLGMYTIQSRIQSLGGQISIDTELGKGARFNLEIPLTETNK